MEITLKPKVITVKTQKKIATERCGETNVLVKAKVSGMIPKKPMAKKT